MESTKTLSTRDEFYTDYMVHRNLTTNLSELDGTDWILTTGSYWIRPSDFIGIRWSEYVGKDGYQMRSDRSPTVGIQSSFIGIWWSEYVGKYGNQLRSDRIPVVRILSNFIEIR
jgi:hypothetical protein